ILTKALRSDSAEGSIGALQVTGHARGKLFNINKNSRDFQVKQVRYGWEGKWWWNYTVMKMYGSAGMKCSTRNVLRVFGICEMTPSSSTPTPTIQPPFSFSLHEQGRIVVEFLNFVEKEHMLNFIITYANDYKNADHKNAAQKNADHKNADHKNADHKNADHKNADHKKADHKNADHKNADH
ncbi:hypothetical protein BC938DRAFT_472490, partial [Jimgerdemannia flammicorona]